MHDKLVTTVCSLMGQGLDHPFGPVMVDLLFVIMIYERYSVPATLISIMMFFRQSISFHCCTEVYYNTLYLLSGPSRNIKSKT